MGNHTYCILYIRSKSEWNDALSRNTSLNPKWNEGQFWKRLEDPFICYLENQSLFLVFDGLSSTASSSKTLLAHFMGTVLFFLRFFFLSQGKIGVAPFWGLTAPLGSTCEWLAKPPLSLRATWSWRTPYFRSVPMLDVVLSLGKRGFAPFWGLTAPLGSTCEWLAKPPLSLRATWSWRTPYLRSVPMLDVEVGGRGSYQRYYRRKGGMKPCEFCAIDLGCICRFRRGSPSDAQFVKETLIAYIKRLNGFPLFLVCGYFRTHLFRISVPSLQRVTIPPSVASPVSLVDSQKGWPHRVSPSHAAPWWTVFKPPLPPRAPPVAVSTIWWWCYLFSTSWVGRKPRVIFDWASWCYLANVAQSDDVRQLAKSYMTNAMH